MVAFTNVLLALTAATAAFAAPAEPKTYKPQPPKNEYKWKVTNWSAGCARAGCYSGFDIAGPKQDIYPKFTAHCNADETFGPYFRECKTQGKQNVKVAAKFLPRESSTSGSPKKFAVSIQFDGEEVSSYYNATGYTKPIYNQFVAPLQNFTITPSEIIGVA